MKGQGTVVVGGGAFDVDVDADHDHHHRPRLFQKLSQRVVQVRRPTGEPGLPGREGGGGSLQRPRDYQLSVRQ